MASNHLVVDLRGLEVGHSSRVDILTGRAFRIGGNTYSPPDRLSLAFEGGDCRVVVFRGQSEVDEAPVVFQVANRSGVPSSVPQGYDLTVLRQLLKNAVAFEAVYRGELDGSFRIDFYEMAQAEEFLLQMVRIKGEAGRGVLAEIKRKGEEIERLTRERDGFATGVESSARAYADLAIKSEKDQAKLRSQLADAEAKAAALDDLSKWLRANTRILNGKVVFHPSTAVQCDEWNRRIVSIREGGAA